ncbi:NlpC/P60 family protein [Streptomyces sp. NPDC097941]|uniref:NlpC/P60 family protein n=1 Tax=Streptomyces sp. NPDC097941 TaxID=3155685 RepID=UPI00331D5FBF
MGVRALANEGCTNLPVRLSVSRIEVDAANWAALPTVTHGDWVRLLPVPFDGTWTAALEQTIRGWAGSTVPDVLAYAAMFLGGAPPVTAGAGPAQGRQVLGEAGYGYVDAQGFRLEGADFHEYMKVGGTFPDGTYKGPSGKQVGNLDCSGYTRMVYGYHLGVPLAADEDTSGTRIPRTSRHIADHAPGVVVDRTTGTAPPPAALLQPGDLVLFNADSSDDGVSLTIDHVGIYWDSTTAENADSSPAARRSTGPPCPISAVRPSSTARGRTPGHFTPCAVSEPGRQPWSPPAFCDAAVTGGVGSTTAHKGVPLVGWADVDRLPHRSRRPYRRPAACRLWF